MSHVEKMSEEQFGKHVVQKFVAHLHTKIGHDDTIKLFDEIEKLSNPSATMPIWTKAEEDRGQSFYTCTDASNFTDPSMLGFKAWIVVKLRYLKDGVEAAKMEVMDGFDEKDFFGIKDSMEKMSSLYSSGKVQKIVILHVFGLILSAKA